MYDPVAVQNYYDPIHTWQENGIAIGMSLNSDINHLLRTNYLLYAEQFNL
jgi:hypothetical protein